MNFSASLEKLFLSAAGQFNSMATQTFAPIQRLPAKITIVVVAFFAVGHLFTTNWSKTGYSFHINHQLLGGTMIQWLLTWDRFDLVTQEWKTIYPITNPQLKNLNLHFLTAF